MQADEVLATGVPLAEAARPLGASDVMPYRWHAEYGAIDPDAVRQPRVLAHCAFYVREWREEQLVARA